MFCAKCYSQLLYVFRMNGWLGCVGRRLAVIAKFVLLFKKIIQAVGKCNNDGNTK